MISSYQQNNYGAIFSALIKTHQPKFVVECGVLSGYSLRHMVNASRSCLDCEFVGIDLFESYEYKHCTQREIEEYFFPWSNVSIVKKDAILASEDFNDETIDLLHIDLSNTGDILSDMFDAWTCKVVRGGFIIFEGGSPERDLVDWMVKYNKTPIQDFKNTLSGRGFEYVTLLPYPSLTICRKGLLR